MHFLASLYSEIPPERFANGIGYNWKNIKVFCADRISVLVGVWFSAYKRIEGVDMKLYLKNIGKVEEAFIELNGITVIAGENNTGKSTVGRALFAVFNAFSNIEKQIQTDRISSIDGLLIRMYVSTGRRLDGSADIKKMATKIVKDLDQYRASEEVADVKLQNFLEQETEGEIAEFDEKLVKETVSRIREVINIQDEVFAKAVLERKLNAEFCNQVRNIFSEDIGRICLEIKNKKIAVDIAVNGGMSIQNPTGLSLHTEAVYLDDPFILDEAERSLNTHLFYEDHRDHLRSKIFEEKFMVNLADEILTKDKLEKIYEKISVVCDGEIVKVKWSKAGYRVKKSDKVLDVRNLSTGLKTFVILKTLLINGTIEQNGTIILDEPEIHLHPEWQLLFAELIVLIQKEFGVHVLLNTHSPYFLNAIEVYAAKYGVAEKCKYYLASLKGPGCVIKDVSDRTEEIYSKLAKPLQVLENERGNL